jgi:queuine tRNA-ribosyltransferase
MDWPRAILADSGGFQVSSLSEIRRVTEEGVLFHSHLDGDRHLFTPESTVDTQIALGSDIMMVLDECIEYPATRDAVAASTRRTNRWAAQAFTHYRRRNVNQALFPIVQGGMYADLRRACAAELVELDAPGYAIGGLSVGEPRDLSLQMVEATAPAPRRQTPLCHGRRQTGGAHRVRRRRHRRDGLRHAQPQRPQRLPVHLHREGDH